ncbi:RHS repeat-associated core domain-containing protein [Pseudomonas libanensis]|uniref:Type IV secretion protein Rhs n=1 Tax=Pseudomonas libanensis TaxID=75588 RepID=A0A0R2YDV4_9PSED|nr:RHS repeat-associated core domain-containing protein [Pseudomonas libanensis]KRP44625.1 type IV secretion protein Rhs [Pseudomonas libanensis]SDL02340.1 RHS repeat-associated core domain-containing protein [Pseudomonas libanensis]
MDIYSNAFNFSSYINGSVDVRTGQYGCHIKLATFNPLGPLEASRDISLGFSMFDTKNNGCGIGWRLSNTEFDENRRRLTLLSGEQYQTDLLPSVGGTLKIINHKLKDIVVKRPDTTTLQVIYNDGTIEILRRTGSTQPYRIVAILFENGERLTFRYGVTGLLERILNQEQEELLVLTYSNGNLSIADTRVDGGRYARVWFLYTNNRLTQVSAPFDRSEARGTASYVFEYRSAFRNGLVPIMRVRSPMGGEELITYAEQGHQYANNQFIPRVTSWVRTPAAKQPPMTLTYVYSPGRNFTGYPFSGGFREGEDNLYQVVGDYEYWTEERSLDSVGDTQLSATHTTYNKYHLLTEERVVREGTRTTTAIIYNTQPGQFPIQPPNFHLPKTIIKRYELVAGGTPREEIQHIETDDYGNELSRTEPSGIRTEYSYYPIAGEPGKCPADPHGLFQRYLKQERLIPAGETPAARLTEYTYTPVPSTGGSYFVLQQSSSQAGAVSLQQTYYEAPVELAGRLKSTTSLIDGLSLVSNFSYSINGDTLSETRRLQGREGQWLESVRTLSLVNRRLLSMTRDGGSTLALAYDVSGRLIAETASPGEPQQAGRRYAYHFATQGRRAHLITIDAQGNRAITYYDGLGRQVAEAQLMSDDSERAIRTWRYDAQGRTVEVVSIDYLPDGPRSLKSTYTYSRWGNASRVTRADGRVEIDEYDPYLNLKIEGIEGGERLKTYFNEHNQPIRVERLDADDHSVEVESRTYDGLGRCLSVLDIVKNLTQFTYDGYNRLLTTLQTPADSTPARLRTNEYAPGTSSEEVSALLVDGKRLGARTYDSLGRMTSQVRGRGPAMILEYEAGWMEPVAMVSALGARQERTYDKELDALSRMEMAGVATSTYKYDPTSGALARSEAGGLIHEVFYDAYGYPEKEVQTADGTVATTLYGHSPGGRLLYQTAADGQRSQLDYDAQGRFQRMTTGTLVIEQDYDLFGRPRTLTTATENMQVITSVSYDSLGREAERRFEQNGALLQVMTSTYHSNSMLATRFLHDADARLVIGETFTYDAYLRLTTYRCEGLEHPKDHRGRGIVGQAFSFDSLNNITQVVTSFADGTQDTCERFFTGTDPTQLTRVTHTYPVQGFTLAYDAAGNLLTGPSGQVYRFNALDQLVEVEAGPFTYSYQYDADARQVLARRAEDSPVMLVYTGDRLETLAEGDKKIRYHSAENQVVARSGGVDGPQLHVNDASGSVRGVSAPGQMHDRRHYTPYGDAHINLDDGKARTMADLQLPAFNGQRLDAAVNLYFLGNGQRAYDPDLMIFLQADPLSPFDQGGLNGYAYCAGNPVNMMDPSGLWPEWLKWTLTGLALALSVVAFKFGGAALMAAIAAKTSTAALAAGLATTAAVATPAATATIISATSTLAALTMASKAAITVGAGLGIVSGSLSIASLSITAVDKAMGWDRSQTVKDLGWASFGFSIASLAVGLGGAYTSAHMAYKLAASKPFGVGASPAGAAVFAARQRMLGLTYKFTDKAGVTPRSITFGATRAALRFINLSRSIQTRFASSPTDGDAPASALPQSQPAVPRIVDMPSSSIGFYQAHRDEAARIRQPILTELMNG